MLTPANANMKFHQAIARTLFDNGCDTIFGLVGDANMFMADSFVHDCGGAFVAASHEYGSALMALGYSAACGKVGLCSVTHGPAMVNTVTALVQGVKASAPMVLLCGDTPVVDSGHAQNVSQREFVIAAGAGFEQVRSSKTVVQDVTSALRRAHAERRPIALNVPIEFDWTEVSYQPIRLRFPESRAVVSVSDELDNAIGLIAAARRPVVLAGRGAASAAARAAVVSLAKRIEAPLATTLKAKDLFRGEDFNLGVFGTASTPAAVEIILESDCVISFGASLNKYTTSNGTFLKGKRLVQVNQEPSELGKTIQPDAAVVGDPGGMAGIIENWLNEAEIPSSGAYTEELMQKIARDIYQAGGSLGHDNGTVDYKGSLFRLDQLLPADRIVVTDGGRFMREAWTMMTTSGPPSFISAIDLGSIGLGLSHAIGAAIAAPRRPVVLVTGDGGFMHGGLTEFNTAVRYRLDLIVVVCNNSAYGAEVSKFANKYPDRKMAGGMIAFDWPDFAPVAVALGGHGVTIRSDRDFDAAEKAISSRSRPLLIDVKLDPDRMLGAH